MANLIPTQSARELPIFSTPSAQRQPHSLPNLGNGNESLWTIRCLGSFQVSRQYQALTKWPSLKSKAIFKYLLTHRHRPIHSEILMDLFWPEVEPEAARRNLHQAIYTLRKTLLSDHEKQWPILFEDDCYSLNPAVPIWIDSEAFLYHYQHGQKLARGGGLAQALKEFEAAIQLYQGDFLADDLYEDWIILWRQNLKFAYLDMLDRLSQHYLSQGQLDICIELCHQLLDQDLCHEEAHQRLIRCYLQYGQRQLALRQYQLCQEALARELNLAPLPATLALYQQIQAA
jgi:DNA-binding SARP family transcriptional activator